MQNTIFQHIQTAAQYNKKHFVAMCLFLDDRQQSVVILGGCTVTKNILKLWLSSTYAEFWKIRLFEDNLVEPYLQFVASRETAPGSSPHTDWWRSLICQPTVLTTHHTLPFCFSSDLNNCPVNTLANCGGGAVVGVGGVGGGAGLHVQYTVNMTKRGTNPGC